MFLHLSRIYFSNKKTFQRNNSIKKDPDKLNLLGRFTESSLASMPHVYLLLAYAQLSIVCVVNWFAADQKQGVMKSLRGRHSYNIKKLPVIHLLILHSLFFFLSSFEICLFNNLVCTRCWACPDKHSRHFDTLINPTVHIKLRWRKPIDSQESEESS